jgi:hypothetical protein
MYMKEGIMPRNQNRCGSGQAGGSAGQGQGGGMGRGKGYCGGRGPALQGREGACGQELTPQNERALLEERVKDLKEHLALSEARLTEVQTVEQQAE